MAQQIVFPSVFFVNDSPRFLKDTVPCSQPGSDHQKTVPAFLLEKDGDQERGTQTPKLKSGNSYQKFEAAKIRYCF